jgi:hypothetical protein
MLRSSLLPITLMTGSLAVLEILQFPSNYASVAWTLAGVVFGVGMSTGVLQANSVRWRLFCTRARLLTLLLLVSALLTASIVSAVFVLTYLSDSTESAFVIGVVIGFNISVYSGMVIVRRESGDGSRSLSV